jgi:hypothetical protein
VDKAEELQVGRAGKESFPILDRFEDKVFFSLLVAIASLALMTCHQKNSGFTGRQVL